MTKNKALLDKYDLSSVWSLFTGAAPLGKETAEDIQRIFPSWSIRQGYGRCSRIPTTIFEGNANSLSCDQA